MATSNIWSEGYWRNVSFVQGLLCAAEVITISIFSCPVSLDIHHNGIERLCLDPSSIKSSTEGCKFTFSDPGPEPLHSCIIVSRDVFSNLLLSPQINFELISVGRNWETKFSEENVKSTAFVL